MRLKIFKKNFVLVWLVTFVRNLNFSLLNYNFSQQFFNFLRLFFSDSYIFCKTHKFYSFIKLFGFSALTLVEIILQISAALIPSKWLVNYFQQSLKFFLSVSCSFLAISGLLIFCGFNLFQK